jgi:hypothetical protein
MSMDMWLNPGQWDGSESDVCNFQEVFFKGRGRGGAFLFFTFLWLEAHTMAKAAILNQMEDACKGGQAMGFKCLGLFMWFIYVWKK